MSYTDKYKVSVPEGRSGVWEVSRFTLKEDDPELKIHNLREAMNPGRGFRVIPPGTYTRLTCDGRGVVMSDTPAEVYEHSSVLYKLEQSTEAQTVLINGLGLGLTLQTALKQSNIQAIDVVEISSDVLSLVAPHYSDPRVTFYLDDAYTIKWPAGKKWDIAWFDIWDDICTDNLEGMSKLHRRYGKRVGWYDSWKFDYLKYEQRREKRYAWY
jgi:hypothetical protein